MACSVSGVFLVAAEQQRERFLIVPLQNGIGNMARRGWSCYDLRRQFEDFSDGGRESSSICLYTVDPEGETLGACGLKTPAT